MCYILQSWILDMCSSKTMRLEPRCRRATSFDESHALLLLLRGQRSWTSVPGPPIIPRR